jgi:hypothetical protein
MLYTEGTKKAGEEKIQRNAWECIQQENANQDGET